jgi:hypothetical protein
LIDEGKMDNDQHCCFVLGDDPTYADNALMITQGHYPPMCEVCVFAFRPLLLFPAAVTPQKHWKKIYEGKKKVNHGEKVI